MVRSGGYISIVYRSLSCMNFPSSSLAPPLSVKSGHAFQYCPAYGFLWVTLSTRWQVVGLAFLFFIGSPQSKEGDDRKEEKMDLIIRLLDPDNGQKEINRLDKKWPRTK